MRVSFFLMIIFSCITILCATFITFHQTIGSIVGMGLILFSLVLIRYKVLKGMGHHLYSHKNIIVCVITIFILMIMTLFGTSSIMVHTGILIIAILLLYMILQFIRQSYKQTLQVKYFTEEMNHFNDSFMQVSAQRHDYMKHIHALDYLLEKDGKSEASQYIGQLIPDYKRINASIKGEKGHIASVLLQFQTFAIDNDITFLMRLDKPLSYVPLQAYEQVQLIGNLLENAMEATNKATHTKRTVSLTSSIVSGLYKLELSNPTKPIPNHIIDHLFSRTHTSTKGDNHGIGTTIIASMIKKHLGTIDYTYNRKQLTIRISLPIIDEEMNK